MHNNNSTSSSIEDSKYQKTSHGDLGILQNRAKEQLEEDECLPFPDFFLSEKLW